MKATTVGVNPEIVNGMRVPALNLIDYIAGGDSLDGFLGNFPILPRKPTITFLKNAGKRMLVAA